MGVATPKSLGTRLHRPHKLSRRPRGLDCVHDSKTGVDVVLIIEISLSGVHFNGINSFTHI